MSRPLLSLNLLIAWKLQGRCRGVIYILTQVSQPEITKAGEDLAKLVIGYTASDREIGLLGTIADYLPHPMNPVFVIQAESKELMVPAVGDFIHQINHTEQSTQFILPEGLTEL